MATQQKQVAKASQARPAQPAQQQTVKKQDIVKIENRGALITTNVPEYLRQEGPVLGTEQVRPSDIKIARFQLAQETTRAAKKQNVDNYIPGLEPGLFYNTMTKQVYGNEVLFIPLLEWPKRLRFPENYDGSGTILCSSENGKVGEGDPGGNCLTCVYAKRIDGKPSPCSNVMTFHILPLQEHDYMPTPDDWCVWGAKRSAIDAAKMLNRLHRMRGPVDLFKCVFKISSFWDTEQTQPCWVPKVDNAEWTTLDQYKFARSFYFSVRNLETAGSIHASDFASDDHIDVTPEPGNDADVAPF
jgi:hypothetical protein